MKQPSWDMLVVMSGAVTVLGLVTILSMSTCSYIGHVNETVNWYQTVVKPQIEAQQARERQVLAAAAQQTPPPPKPTPPQESKQ
jgi:hypothetical protein